MDKRRDEVVCLWSEELLGLWLCGGEESVQAEWARSLELDEGRAFELRLRTSGFFPQLCP